MKTYQVFQINARQLFRNNDSDVVEARYFDIVHGGALVNEDDFWMYRPVCNIKARDLDEVFQYGNMGSEEHIERLERMHSISVGDIILDTETGQYSAVSIFGFQTIEDMGAIVIDPEGDVTSTQLEKVAA